MCGEIREDEKVEQLKVKLGLGKDLHRPRAWRKSGRERMVPTLPPSWFTLARRKSQPQHPFWLLCSLHRDVWDRHARPRCVSQNLHLCVIYQHLPHVDWNLRQSKIKSDLISRVATSSKSSITVYLNFGPQLIYQPLPAPPPKYHQRPADV